MSHDFENADEYELAMFDLDEYDPVEKFENLAAEVSETGCSQAVEALDSVSNDDFMAAIFGSTFDAAYPLVCKKSGNPGNGGWLPLRWPCNTSDPDQNWYALPSLYKPDDTGRYRAKKELAVAVFAVMVDDVGTKVSAERFVNCPPSWAIETVIPPKNHGAEK